MTSVLSSKSISTYIGFYLMVSSNIENKNIILLNRFDKSYTDLKITKQAYYVLQ